MQTPLPRNRFVIGSSSTTDWNGRDPVVQYAIFLMRPELRLRAWWSRTLTEAMRFETREEAEAYRQQIAVDPRYDVVVDLAGTDYLGQINAERAARRAKGEYA